MLKPESLNKTARGLLPSFSEIFTGARYARQLYSDRQRGTAHDTRPGEVFLGIERWSQGSDVCTLPQSFQGTAILVVTPTPEFWRVSRYGRDVQALRLIPWRGDGAWLVTGVPGHYVGTDWHAFVPLSESFEVESTAPNWPPAPTCPHGRGFHCPQCWGAK